MCIVVNIVLVNEFLWYVGKSDLHKFGAVQWGTQVEVLDVEAGKSGIAPGEHTVEHRFG